MRTRFQTIQRSMTVLFVALLSAGFHKVLAGINLRGKRDLCEGKCENYGFSYSLFGVAIYLASYTFWRELKILKLLNVMFNLIVKADMEG